MSRGKSINLYLMDGDSGGRIKCTLANWTGVAYRIPRTDIEKCRNREDLKQSGVYLLFGVSDETGNPVVYVGQAGSRKNGEGLLNRLLEHKRNPDKDYWTEAVALTTTNNSFGQTEISYLENQFCSLAREAKRYDVQNSIEPTSGNITEEKECELEEFVEYAQLIIGTLGHKVFVPLTKQESADTFGSEDAADSEAFETELFLTRKLRKPSFTVQGHAKRTSEGFVVLKGSVISPESTKNISLGIRARRKAAAVNNDHVLQEDVLCSSPSGAAAFVIGNAANGWEAWKTQDGTSLQDLEGRTILTDEG